MRGWFMAGIVVAAVVGKVPVHAAEETPHWQTSFAHDEFQSGDATLRYRLFTPVPAEDGTQPPLVIFLHGAGERGDDNAAQLKHGVVEFYKRQQKHPCVVFAPQCPAESMWVKIDWSAPRGEAVFPEAP